MIDLSKAYAGQIITLQSGEKHEIKKVSKRNDTEYLRFIVDTTEHYSFTYFENGVHNTKSYLDIVSIEDSIQIQVARLEGELKGMKRANEYAVRSNPEYFEALLAELKTQLLTLQNNQ